MKQFSQLFVLLLAFFQATFTFAAPALPEDPPITHTVEFTIKRGEDDIGVLKLGLFGTIVPETVKNFFGLASMEKGFGYQDDIFHRVIKDFMIQGGSMRGDGGYALTGPGTRMVDENFELKHDRPGRLSMANSGPDTNGSQFFITSVVTQWLDGIHVVFGQLLDGFETLDIIENTETDIKDKPIHEIRIASISVKKENSGSIVEAIASDPGAAPPKAVPSSGAAAADDDDTKSISNDDKDTEADELLGATESSDSSLGMALENTDTQTANEKADPESSKTTTTEEEAGAVPVDSGMEFDKATNSDIEAGTADVDSGSFNGTFFALFVLCGISFVGYKYKNELLLRAGGRRYRSL